MSFGSPKNAENVTECVSAAARGNAIVRNMRLLERTLDAIPIDFLVSNADEFERANRRGRRPSRGAEIDAAIGRSARGVRLTSRCYRGSKTVA